MFLRLIYLKNSTFPRLKIANKEITTTCYYVNSRKHVDSEKIRVKDGIWTHDPPWASRMFYHWATGDTVVSKGEVVGIDWNRISRLHSHVLAHMLSPRVPLFCSYHILTSSVIYYWTDARQHGIYLLNWEFIM